MPTKQTWIRPLSGIAWEDQRGAGQFVVIPPIFEIFPDSAADFEAEARIDRDISPIEKRVDIRTEKDAVIDFVLPAFPIRPDMSGFEHGQRLLSGYGAFLGVGIRHHNPESALA